MTVIEHSKNHKVITRTETQQIYNPATEAMMDKIVEYRACGCVIWRNP